MTLPCMIDQNAAHQLCGDSEEVGAVLPTHIFLINQTEECLVDEGRCLQGMSGPLVPQVTCGLEA